MNVFGALNGLDGVEFDRLLSVLVMGFPVRAVTLSAYDPSFDTEDCVPGNRTAFAPYDRGECLSLALDPRESMRSMASP